MGVPAPFFVLGSQRSGTTMLRLMLNAHSALAVPHETGFITNFYHRLPEYGDLSAYDNRRRLLEDIANTPLVRRGRHLPSIERVLARPAGDYPGLISAIMQDYAESQGKCSWGDKTPYYTGEMEVLYQLFPRAKFIHLVRDGRDVAISQKTISWLPNSLPRIARDWKWKVTLCHKLGSILPGGQFLEVKYENLVLDTEKTLATICRFIGIEFQNGMLNYHVTASHEVPDISQQWHKNSIREPDPAKVSAWRRKMGKSDRIIFEQIAGDTLDIFGYERERLNTTLMSQLKNLYYHTVVRV